MAGVELATGYVQLVASAKGIQSSITSELGGVVGAAGDTGAKAGAAIQSGAGKGISGLAKMAAAGLAGGAVLGFLKDSTAEAAEAAKVGALTAQVIKTTGAAAGVSAEQIGELSGAISAKTGIDDEAIQSGANLLLTFTNVKNGVGEGNDIFNQTTGIMTDMSAALGTDASGAAIQLGKALNDPIKGIAALSRVGVSFTADQKAQIKTLVESGDTMGAQKVILAELSKEFGGAAEAAALPAEKLGVAWGNFKESVGTAIAPMMNSLAEALQKMLPFITENADKLVPLVAGFAGLLVVSKLIGMVKSLSSVMGIFNAVMALNPVVLVVLAIAGLVVGFVILWKKSEAFRNFWIGLWDRIKAVTKIVVDWIVKAWNNTVEWLGKLPGRVWGFLQFLWTKVTEAAAAVDQWIKDRWNDVIDFISGIAGRVWSWLSGLWDGVIAAAAAVDQWIKDRWNDVIDFISGIAGRVWSWLVGLWDGVIAAATVVDEWIKARWNDVIDFIASIPGRIWAFLGTLWDGVQAAAETAVGWVTGAWDGLVGFFADLGGKVWGAIMGFLNGIGVKIADLLYSLGILKEKTATVTDLTQQTLSADTPGAKAARDRLRAQGIDLGALGITGNAAGGMIPAGWSLVGERGAELVHKTGSSARVYSNKDSQGMFAGGAGATVSIVNHFGTDSVRKPSDITDLTRAVARETNRALRAAGVPVPISGAA